MNCTGYRLFNDSRRFDTFFGGIAGTGSRLQQLVVKFAEVRVESFDVRTWPFTVILQMLAVKLDFGDVQGTESNIDSAPVAYGASM